MPTSLRADMKNEVNLSFGTCVKMGCGMWVGLFLGGIFFWAVWFMLMAVALVPATYQM